MAENLTKVPKRGILKASTSFEQRDQDPSGLCRRHSNKNPHFDEMNIIATLHPADKDYGFMKIEEPKTPFEYASDNEEEGAAAAAAPIDDLDANLLAAKIASEGHKGPRIRKISEPSLDEEDLKLLSPEERERRKSFEQKRKAHYNEFHAVKLARQLMASDAEEDDEDEDEGHNNEEVEEDEEDKKSDQESTSESTTASASAAAAVSLMDTTNSASSMD